MRLYRNQVFPSDVSLPLDSPRELHDPELLQINRLAPRATSVPAQKAGVYYYNKEESDRFFSLNGDYRFALFSDAALAAFEQASFDDSGWDLLDVPSMWQFRGYGEPTYPNVEYPFPFNPPYICRLNPVGCYRRTFTYHKNGFSRFILHFEGVDNACYVYLNGAFVGFSKGSRIPAEYDVTDYLREGENLLAVKVYTYSDASYLENQDMLLASGIFRDVYLIACPDSALWDLSLITDTKTLKVTATLFDACEDAEIRLTLGDDAVTLKPDGKVVSYVFVPENPKLWNAETPNLYDFTLEILKNGAVVETHSKRVGFVHSEIGYQRFLVNGTPVRFRGINRHENNCDNGRYITVPQIYEDLCLLKSHNINAIRCSHYPNNPAFYEYASMLGFYVMDEADLESHGCGITGDQGFLNKSPKWKNAFFDRVVRMAERDKNETCVMIWSVGNEIGAGDNADACAEWLAAREDKKPVQLHAYKIRNAFVGTGYDNLLMMNNVYNSSLNDDRPICLIEYAHGMGNSPGNLEHLWNFVMTHDSFCGGFVWEFRSHGKRRKNADGTVDYLYGGDFHDDNHWSNFTLDGYCTSDGTPKPTFHELKYVYAPVRFAYEDGVLTLENTNDFVSTAGLTLELSFLVDGKTVEKKTVPMPDLPARAKGTLAVPFPYEGHDRFLTARVIDRGDVTAMKQFILPATCDRAPLPAAPFFDGTVTEDGHKISVIGKNYKVIFYNGLPALYQKDGTVFFDKPMEFVTYRAETDNDGIVSLYPRWIGVWEAERLHKMRFFTLSSAAETDDADVRIKTTGFLTADHCFTGFNITVTFTISHNGLLRVSMDVLPFGRILNLNSYGSCGHNDEVTPRLPRFGVCFCLPKNFTDVAWYGRGQEQNYTDALAGAPVGVYQSDLAHLNFAYDVPQETGSRIDTRWLTVASPKAKLAVYANETLTFSYHPWKLADLKAARHPSELKESSENYLYLDYRMRALGSFSCGPNPEREFDFEPHDFRFSFALDAAAPAAEPLYANCGWEQKTEALSGVYQRPEIETEREIIECRSVD